MELYANAAGLIPRAEWEQLIDELQRQTIEVTDAQLESALDELKQKIIDATLRRAQEAHAQGARVGVFFSGGVDSTTIAYILKKNAIPFMCFTAGFHDVGTKEPEDIEQSKIIAKELDFEHTVVTITKDEAHELFNETAALLRVHVINPITIGVGSVIVAAARAAKQAGCTHLFAGLGSEELFAGYQRHELVSDNERNLQNECWSGLRAMWARDLERDCALAAGLDITVHTPLLDEAVIGAAMRIPATQKIHDFAGVSYKKYCFRKIACELGLPKQHAFRPKRAAQYGSRLDSALDKVARAKGLGKKEYCAKLKKV